MSVNKVILMGGLTRDPEVRFMPNGEAVANFSLATNETWKDKSGVKKEKSEYHNVVAYRKLGEIIGEYCKKGSQVFIEGKLQTRKWEKDGVTRYTTEVIADKMQMVGGKNNASGDTSSGSQEDNQPQARSEQSGRDPSDFSNFDDDIPFMNPYKFCWRNV